MKFHLLFFSALIEADKWVFLSEDSPLQSKDWFYAVNYWLFGYFLDPIFWLYLAILFWNYYDVFWYFSLSMSSSSSLANARLSTL